MNIFKKEFKKTYNKHFLFVDTKGNLLFDRQVSQNYGGFLPTLCIGEYVKCTEFEGRVIDMYTDTTQWDTIDDSIVCYVVIDTRKIEFDQKSMLEKYVKKEGKFPPL